MAIGRIENLMRERRRNEEEIRDILRETVRRLEGLLYNLEQNQPAGPYRPARPMFELQRRDPAGLSLQKDL